MGSSKMQASLASGVPSGPASCRPGQSGEDGCVLGGVFSEVAKVHPTGDSCSGRKPEEADLERVPCPLAPPWSITPACLPLQLETGLHNCAQN